MAKPKKPESHKTAIIEMLFDDRWDAASGVLSRPIVTLSDISAAIDKYNKSLPSKSKKLSKHNPANFFKDFFRRKDSANRNWPSSVWSKGYAARQLTGSGNAFEFVRIFQGQSEPFPISTATYPRSPQAPHLELQSLSMLPIARSLGRRDETWLMQVAVQLNLIETHFALCSIFKSELQHVSHLQIGIKLRHTEIDGLYLAQFLDGSEAIITLEAKGRKDDILEEQVLAQVKAVLSMEAFTGKKCIVPMAIKIIGDSEIYVVEYESIDIGRNAPGAITPIASEAVYRLKPPVPGIS